MSIRPLLERAVSLLQAGDAAEALVALGEALQLAPADFDAPNLSGVAATRIARNEEALAFLRRATEVRPSHAGAQNNLGIALRAAGENAEAATAYRRAITLEPRYPAARTNLGTVLLDMREYEAAVDSFDRSLALRPDHAETLTLRSTALRHLLRYEEALESLDRAMELMPVKAEHQVNRAGLLAGLDRHVEAMEAYRKAQELSPDDPTIPGLIIQNQLRLCDWTDLDRLRTRVRNGALSGQPTIPPFSGLMLFDEPDVHLALSRSWQARHVVEPLEAPNPPPAGKLRVGYFSADMRNHPTMHLIGEMLALHDHDRLEVTVFAFPAGVPDHYTEQVRSAVDRFIDIGKMSDSEAVELARGLSIDVAIDLMGNTRGARPRLFRKRVAPVQVNYMGYPGTFGATCMDYIIADRMIIPEHATVNFTEQVVWLPDCYTSRDTRIDVPMADRGARVTAGLPDEAMVFCSFNQSSKILPEQFDDWMEILRQVDGSVLWLLDAGEVTNANLRREAQARNVDPARLIFASRMPLVEHLERLQLADLCLDTLPYNAHTTANDALFVGVPILTRPGRAFAARVCASLLMAVGMPELIAEDRAAYIARAVELGRDRTQLAALRARLDMSRKTTPLFDIERFTRSVEAGYAAVHERYRQGLAPAHILIEGP